MGEGKRRAIANDNAFKAYVLSDDELIETRLKSNRPEVYAKIVAVENTTNHQGYDSSAIFETEEYYVKATLHRGYKPKSENGWTLVLLGKAGITWSEAVEFFKPSPEVTFRSELVIL